jgi:CRISPR-associated protein Csy3
MSKEKKEITMPSVLSFEKKLVPSDGFMYGLVWEDRNNDQKRAQPLEIIEKSVRGTISHRLSKKDMKEDPMKFDAKICNANPQTVDHCALSKEQDTLKLHFTLKILGGIENPSVCNDSLFKPIYQQQAKKYIDEVGFGELAQRYVTNIANARFLWRNRVGVDDIEVIVKDLTDQNSTPLLFQALTFGLNNFDHNNDDIKTLAEKISTTLANKDKHLLLDITACVKVGKAQTVYPSEELVLEDKNNKSNKSKILYQVNNIAAMHSQKIGNALRTIDTWYPKEETDIGAIAVESYGSVTTHGKAYRTPKDKEDFYSLFDKWSRNIDKQTIEQQHYIMAMLVRGGVFGQSKE